jgi:hypothetical protein
MVCPIDQPVRMVTTFEVLLQTLEIRIPLIIGTQVQIAIRTVKLPDTMSVFSFG